MINDGQSFGSPMLYDGITDTSFEAEIGKVQQHSEQT